MIVPTGPLLLLPLQHKAGGYVPLKVGGIDLVAVVTARMKG